MNGALPMTTNDSIGTGGCSPSAYRIAEIFANPSDNRIVHSSDPLGWVNMASVVVDDPETSEHILALNTSIHIGLALKPMKCEIAGEQFSGQVIFATGSTSIVAPLSRLLVNTLTPTSLFSVHIRPGVFGEVCEDVYERKLDSIDIIQNFGSSDHALSNLMYSLYYLLLGQQKDQFHHEYIGRAIAAQVLVKFAQLVGARERIDLRTPLTNRQISLIDDFLAANLHGRFHLSELAASIGLSRTVFFKRFAHTMRQSPNQYLQKLRVDRAQTLLKNTNLSLSEIAIASGYSDQSHMTRFFVRHTGMTPAKCRSMMVGR